MQRLMAEHELHPAARVLRERAARLRENAAIDSREAARQATAAEEQRAHAAATLSEAAALEKAATRFDPPDDGEGGVAAEPTEPPVSGGPGVRIVNLSPGHVTHVHFAPSGTASFPGIIRPWPGPPYHRPRRVYPRSACGHDHSIVDLNADPPVHCVACGTWWPNFEDWDNGAVGYRANTKVDD